jgi:hypothetical protein
VDPCGTGSATISACVIGGAIQGDTTINYFGIYPVVTKTLTAAGGQPDGTTYSWSISGPGTLLNANFPAPTWTGSTATYRAIGPSRDPGDVRAVLHYILGPCMSTATVAITALKPTWMIYASGTVPQVWYPGQNHDGIFDDPKKPWYGFDNYNVSYVICDQYRHPMPMISWNVMWLDFRRPAAANQSYELPQSIGGGSDTEGYITEFHDAMYYTQVPDPNLEPNNWVEIYSFVTQEFRAGCMDNGAGVLIATHHNVEYRTNGVTNEH